MAETGTSIASAGQRLAKFRGCVALVGSAVNAVVRNLASIYGPDHPAIVAARLPLLRELERRNSAEAVDSQDAAASQTWHITLLTKEECRTSSPAAVNEALAGGLLGPFYCLGVGGSASSAVFGVVVWPGAQAFRAKHGLPLKQFHLTLSPFDNHAIDKGYLSLSGFPQLPDEEPSISSLSSRIVRLHSPAANVDVREALCALSHQLLLVEKNAALAFEVALHLCSSKNDQCDQGWLRLADAAMSMGHYKVAMLAFAHVARSPRTTSERLVKFCVQRLFKCAEHTEWGTLCLEDESLQIPTALRPVLLQPWSQDLRRLLWSAAEDRSSDSFGSALPLPSRVQFYLPGMMGPSSKEVSHRSTAGAESLAGEDQHAPETHRMSEASARSLISSIGAQDYHMPRFFRWVVPFCLAAMSTPRNAADIACLQLLGIKHVVTLTEESPLPESWFNASIGHTHMPVPNYEPPTFEQVDIFMDIVSKHAPVLVHCGGGKGRAGTMLASYLVAYGFRTPFPDTWELPAMTAGNLPFRLSLPWRDVFPRRTLE
jgi:atypical dual specificity phosphatase